VAGKTQQINLRKESCPLQPFEQFS